MSLNQDIYDREVLHQIDLQDYSKSLKKTVKRTGDQVRRDLYDPQFPLDTDKGLSRLKSNLLKRHRELKSFIIGERNDWLQGEINFQAKQLDTGFYKARRVSRRSVLKTLALPGI